MYDAIIVGARAAGAPTAMLLARTGRRVLLVDRATFPSDTLSTHYIHQPGVAALRRWGLLEKVKATGCPPIRDYTLDTGPFALHGAPPPIDGVAEAYSPRRHVLDRILAVAAAKAGAEVRERFAVDGVVFENGRAVGVCSRDGDVERGRLIIGADGRHSMIAKAVHAPEYDGEPPLTCAYYAYWSGVEMTGAELYPRDGRMIVASPTHDGHVVVIAFWPREEFDAVRKDVARSFHEALPPGLAERLRGGRREERFRGTLQAPNRFRKPYGPGWALVGDAGFHKDPIMATGITDAFRDAELLADAVQSGDFEGYERRRNEMAAGSYATALQFAGLQPPPEIRQLWEMMRGDQAMTDAFLGTLAGTVSQAEFMAAAGARR
jgi:flavin-dependent dehydrogenase